MVNPIDDDEGGGGVKGGQRLARGDSIFGLGSPSRGRGSDGRGGSSDERVGYGGPPPAWPEEAALRARKVIQTTLFPEFDTFDAVRRWGGGELRLLSWFVCVSDIRHVQQQRWVCLSGVVTHSALVWCFESRLRGIRQHLLE